MPNFTHEPSRSSLKPEFDGDSRSAGDDVDDIPLVTIPLTEYKRLLRIELSVQQQSISIQLLTKPTRSTVERNPEVANFITLRLGQMPVRQIMDECRRRFGKRQTPSQNVIYRYWEKLRIEARKQL